MIGVVVGGTLNRRVAPEDKANTYGQYKDGAYITFQEYDSTWYKTTFSHEGKQRTGYVKKAFVVAQNDTIEVRKTNVSVRAQSDLSSAVLYYVNSGAGGSATKLESGGGFGWIQSNYGQGVGWVRGDMLRKTGNSDDGDKTIGYDCRTIPGGANAYHIMNINATFTFHEGSVVVVDEGYDPWLAWYANEEPMFFQRKNIDVSYDTSKAITTVFGTDLLKNGSNGRYVTHLQHYLNRYLAQKKLAKIATDGVFGGGTLTTVRNFQTYVGLKNDGIVGTDTKNALKAYVRNL